MLALAESLSFPDIPRLFRPRELGHWSQAPALFVTCDGWQEESDNEVSEPLWLSGSFLPITQHLISSWSGALFDHRYSALWGTAKSGNGLMLSARVSLKPDFPFSTRLSNWRWPWCLHVWRPVWQSGVCLRPFSLSRHARWPLWAGKRGLRVKVANLEFWWILEAFYPKFPNQLGSWKCRGSQ